VKAVLNTLAMDEAPAHGLAFDRASVRTYDRDGRLMTSKPLLAALIAVLRPRPRPPPVTRMILGVEF